MAQAAPLAYGRLLDVGCGNKPYRHLFCNVEGYIGLDLPDNSAKSRAVDVYGSALHLPFASFSFDSVVCTQVLEHVPEPGLLLREVSRVLKPSGLLILTAPQAWGPHEIPNDYFRFTSYGLRYLANAEKLQAKMIIPTTGTFGMVGQRLSSFVYLSFGYERPLFLCPILLLCALIQLACEGMDRLFKRQGDTLDHLMVAKSRHEAGE